MMDRERSELSIGQGLVEYALILVLVAVVVIVILTLLGPAVGSVFSEILNPLGGPGDGPPGDCYSTLLIAIMVGAMGIATLTSQFVPSKWVEKISFAISRVV
jgi:pilus assembly protein Flp/PilA